MRDPIGVAASDVARTRDGLWSWRRHRRRVSVDCSPELDRRLPLQGGPLAFLVLLGAAGRAGMLVSARIGAGTATVLDLAFPLVFLAVVAREIVAGRNWRNLPMLAALTLLAAGNILVHLEAVGILSTAEVGNRIGVATLLMLITFVGGRIIPSFTRSWPAKRRPEVPPLAAFGATDRIALVLAAVALAAWVIVPQSAFAPWAELTAGVTVGLRLSRWRGNVTLREPLLWVLHLGYGWVAVGFMILGLNGLLSLLPETAALHSLTVGAIGTMTLAVMTRASLGHTGRQLVAGPGTTAIYLLVTLAALPRLTAPLNGAAYAAMLALAGAAWSGAFGLFALLYARPLAAHRIAGEQAKPI